MHTVRGYMKFTTTVAYRAMDDLIVPYARIKYRKFSLKFRGPLVWNMIPLNIRGQKLFYLFKTKCKKCMYIMSNHARWVESIYDRDNSRIWVMFGKFSSAISNYFLHSFNVILCSLLYNIFI